MKLPLPLLAMGLGHTCNIEIVFDPSATTAATNGRKIILPELPADSPEIEPLLLGYIAHEAAHIRFTDFSIPTGTPLLHGLMNVLEDIRIEQKIGSLYPGVRKKLAVLSAILADDDREVALDSPQSVLFNYLITALRDRLLNHYQGGNLEEIEDAFDQFFPGLRQKIWDVASQSLQAAGTEEIKGLASEILALLKVELEDQKTNKQPQEEKNTPDTGNDSGTPDQSSGSDTPDGNNDSDRSDASNASGQSGQSGKSGTPSKSTESCTSVQFSSDAIEALEEFLSSKMLGDPREEKVAKMLQNELVANHDTKVRPLPIQKTSYDEYTGISEQLIGKTSQALQVRLVKLLASKKDALLPARSGRKLRSNRLVPILTGSEKKAFMNRVPQQQENTALHILVDASGSMGSGSSKIKRGSRIQLANIAICALQKVLQRNRNINLGITAFGHQMVDVLPHNSMKNLIPVDARLGNTATGEAMLSAADLLLRQREKRKILIVLTDGMPNNPDSTEQVVSMLEKMDFQLACLGIQDSSGKRFFKNFQEVEDVKKLPQQFFNLLEQLL